MSEVTGTALAQAQEAFADARARAMGATTTGLRVAAWRLRRRREQLDTAALARLRAITVELGTRGRVTPA